MRLAELSKNIYNTPANRGQAKYYKNDNPRNVLSDISANPLESVTYLTKKITGGWLQNRFVRLVGKHLGKIYLGIKRNSSRGNVQYTCKNMTDSEMSFTAAGRVCVCVCVRVCGNGKEDRHKLNLLIIYYINR